MISSVCKSEGVFQGLGDEHRKNALGPQSVWGSVISWDNINSKRNKQMTPERTKQYQAIILHTNSKHGKSTFTFGVCWMLRPFELRLLNQYSIQQQVWDHQLHHLPPKNGIPRHPNLNARLGIPMFTEIKGNNLRRHICQPSVKHAGTASGAVSCGPMARQTCRALIQHFPCRLSLCWAGLKPRHSIKHTECPALKPISRILAFFPQRQSRKASTSSNHIQATLQVKIQKKQSKSPPPPPPPPQQQQQQQRHAVAYNYYCRAVWLATVCIHSWCFL